MMQYKPKVKAPSLEILKDMQAVLKRNSLVTVCEEAACPNRAECYARSSATFMILGDTCTRACKFCNVKTGRGQEVDKDEPKRLAKAIRELGLKYVVITSVDRDDLKDYGSNHFANCVKAIKDENPDIKIELLTPDFRYDEDALQTIVECGADKLAHNQETIKRLSKTIRPQSSYERSLKVLKYYASYSNVPIKSSLMCGLGETKEELLEAMQDLLDVGVSELTLGQYLQPTKKHHKVEKYYPPEFFEEMREKAFKMGFKAVASGILVRSSYFAEELGSNR